MKNFNMRWNRTRALGATSGMEVERATMKIRKLARGLHHPTDGPPMYVRKVNGVHEPTKVVWRSIDLQERGERHELSVLHPNGTVWNKVAFFSLDTMRNIREFCLRCGLTELAHATTRTGKGHLAGAQSWTELAHATTRTGKGHLAGAQRYHDNPVHALLTHEHAALPMRIWRTHIQRRSCQADA
ncbi:hypothetical protein CYMTET_48620 [Cymbomonas tetramitiformis]|uniref:Uncharacterized protein n=1 Tax=Cymbomonas tetramitiformis TaxID=36881 RepID=A0AAE0BRV6_9CHLO|nr:hypothetical protein CYMTET_48620 [Cymbomonas tetramitiformis]